GSLPQFLPVDVMAVPALFWRLSPLVLLLALVLPRASMAVNGTSSLMCFYNSKANLSCAWEPTAELQSLSCRVLATSDKRTWSKSCMLLPDGPASWACNLQLGDNGESQSLTAADTLNLTVTCCQKKQCRMVKTQFFKPFDNLRLMAPKSLQVTYREPRRCNITWKVFQSSHYIESDLQFKVRLRSSDQRWEDASLMSINQNQQWIFLENLAADTRYELQVSVRPYSGSSNAWSPWSQPLAFVTRPEGAGWGCWSDRVSGDTSLTPVSASPTVLGKEMPTFPWWPQVIVGFGGTLCFLILVYLLANCRYIVPWLKKVLKCHIPDPSEFFAQLSSEHGGDFQKWLSSPFPSSSFISNGLAPEISPLEVLDRDTKPMQLLRLQQDKLPSPSPSGHSLTSCFTNQGYFFFHLPDALEIEACQVYFTYDPYTEEPDEGGPGVPGEALLPPLPNPPGEVDAYCTFPPGEDLLLFSPRLVGSPVPLNTVPECTGAGEEKPLPSVQVGVPRDWVPQNLGPPSLGTPDLVDFQSPLGPALGDTEDEVSAPDSGERPGFPWVIPPGQSGVRAPPSCLTLNTDAYLSLQELQDQDPAHLA
ncbi:Interleukin-2 receptor subunit beta, partial [Galemys pyrenaicus]